MRILVPCSQRDAAQLTPFVDLLLRFLTLENHFVTFVPTASQAHATVEAANRLRPACPNVSVEPMPIDPIGGWPKACNAQFVWAMKRMQEIGNAMPIFWMELDCLPLKKFWADQLAGDYAAQKKACLGAMYQTRQPDGQGGFNVNPNDWQMAGCGMYPPDFINRTRLWKYLGVTDTSLPGPFDWELRFEMLALGMGNTPLIGNRWRTKNYQPDLSCENANKDKWGFDHSKNDVSGACVLHGCKDESLYRILMGQEVVAAQPQEPKAIPLDLPVRDDANIVWGRLNLNKRLDDVEAKIERLTKLMEKVLAQPVSTPLPPLADAEPPAPEAEGIWPPIRTMLSLQKWKLGDLAKTADMPKDELKQLLESKGYEIRGPAQWVGEKALAEANG